MELTDKGVLLHDGMAVGHIGEEDWPVEGPEMFVAAPTIVLNLGWCRMAGVHVVVLDDPERDRHRNGITLQR